MVDSDNSDNLVDYVSSWSDILRGDSNNLNDTLRRDKQRSRLDYGFKAKSARQIYKIDFFGSGRSFPVAPLEFNYLFVEEPTFTFGIVAKEGISAAYVGNATAFVLRYVQNDKGFYIGAYMAFYVDVRDSTDASVNQPVKIVFNCIFDGISMTIPLSAG